MLPACATGDSGALPPWQSGAAARILAVCTLFKSISGGVLVAFVWFIIWLIDNNVGGSDRPRLVR
jgi:hypothetical protein